MRRKRVGRTTTAATSCGRDDRVGLAGVQRDVGSTGDTRIPHRGVGAVPRQQQPCCHQQFTIRKPQTKKQ